MFYDFFACQRFRFTVGTVGAGIVRSHVACGQNIVVVGAVVRLKFGGGSLFIIFHR